jgi:phospholipid transport system substrate-binding protein
MLTRRLFLASTAVTGLLLAAGPRAWAQSAQDATAFIARLGEQLVAVINGPGSYEEKKRQLQPLVERATDVAGIGQFVLGRYARSATPQQLDEFLRVFHDVLMENIFSKVGQYQGVTFRMTTTQPREGEFLVGSVITLPNQAPANVQWVVRNEGGQFKIVDVVPENVSLRLTQRSDYAAYLQRNGNNLEALISAMKQQLRR